MKKIYSAPQISEILVEKPTYIISTSDVYTKLVSDGEASDDEDATLSKTIDFSDKASEW